MSNSSDRDERFYIVAIGASAGGIQALEMFFANLPENPNAAFVVILHQTPDTGHGLAEILQRQTSLDTAVIRDGMEAENNTIYIQPPHTYLDIRNYHFHLSDYPETGIAHPITHFFQSLARECGEKAIAIVLSGTGSDGADGLRNIGRAGGVALVQSPETAQFQGMPSSAIPSGLVDEILSPMELAQVVYDIIHLAGERRIYPQPPNVITPEQLGQILDVLATKQQTNFCQYKTTTLNRRIAYRFALSRLGSIESYIRYLRNSAEEQKKLCQDILIGATRFFRDPPAWEIIAGEVLPQLINRLGEEDQLRIWISACATGEEAYTMAMLLDEAIRSRTKTVNYKIFATDLDTQALEVAANGVYPESIPNDISAERLERYFVYDNGSYRVKRTLREMLIFAPHDLTSNPGFSRMTLVTCRNVLIYMQPQLQQRVLRLLHFSLIPQGVLFLGDTESLGELSDEFVTVNHPWKIYRKCRDTKVLIAGAVTNQPAVIAAPLGSLMSSNVNQSLFGELVAEIFKQSFNSRELTCLVVNRENRLMSVIYNTAQLLDFPLGEANLDVTQNILPPLKLPLATALNRAKRTRESVMYTGVKVNRKGREERLTLKVGYNPDVKSLEGYLIVIIEVDNPVFVSAQVLTNYEIQSDVAQQIVELEHELQQTRENLQAVVEELETFNEEQQATNEELLASNEELQSTNEELQSTNEELYTVNAEYQSKIDQLTRLTDDVDNLLRSTDIGVLFLDLDLKIRRFTPAATAAVNIKPTDINRSLSDLTNNLDCPNLLGLLREVLVNKERIELQVTLLTTGEDWLMRINRYLREDGSCDGLVVTFVNVNDLKTIQRRLESTNHLLEHLYDTSPVGLFLLDEEFRFLRVNSVLAEINNLPAEEHLGKTVSEVVPEFAEQLIPIYRQVLETETPVKNVELEGRKPSDSESAGSWLGTFYPVQMNADLQAIGGIIVEITELKRAQKELQESRSLVEQITESSPGIILIFNLESQTISYVNHCVLELLGYRPDEVKNKGIEFFEEVVHPEDIDRVKGHYREFEEIESENIADCQPVELEYRMRHRNGDWRWFLSREVVFRRTEAGQPQDVLGINTDITVRKQAQLELQQLNQTLEERVRDRTSELEEAKQKAEEANAAKTQFLHRITHELRSPLNIILGFAQLLGRSDNLGAQQRQHLSLIYNNGQQLLGLINDLLDLGKIEANRMDLNPDWFDLRPVLESLKIMFGIETERKNLELAIEVGPGVPECIYADEQKLRQVLINLVGNAIKFTDAGRIVLRVNVAEMPPDGPEDSPRLRFEVEDTGRGIAPEELEYLFQAFVQGKAGRTSRQGTGLGLAIARHFVEMMGGEIGVESEVGSGSRFSFTVRTALPAEPDSQASPGGRIVGLAPDQPRCTVLVADDRPDNRELLTAMLGSLGFEVVQAENGLQAVARFEERRPQLILMDIQMPEMDGLEAVRRIKETPEGEGTAIFAVSAFTLIGGQREILERYCSAILLKPFPEEVLLDKIAECLGVRYVYGE